MFDNKDTSPPELSKIIELQEVQTESQGHKSHSKATELVHTKSEGVEPQIKGPKLEVEIQNEDNAIPSKVKEPVLAKYVRRHHAPNHITRDKSYGTMTRRKLKGTCLLVEFEPRSVKDALENESWIETQIRPYIDQ